MLRSVGNSFLQHWEVCHVKPRAFLRLKSHPAKRWRSQSWSWSIPNCNEECWATSVVVARGASTCDGYVYSSCTSVASWTSGVIQKATADGKGEVAGEACWLVIERGVENTKLRQPRDPRALLGFGSKDRVLNCCVLDLRHKANPHTHRSWKSQSSKATAPSTKLTHRPPIH